MKLRYGKINMNFMENDFQIKEINTKERATFQNDGNEQKVHKKLTLLRQQEQSEIYNPK